MNTAQHQSAPATMRIEAILNGGPNAAVANGISFATARRWLARPGGYRGSDRKGHVDRHEKTFLPCWLSIRPTLRERLGGPAAKPEMTF